MEILNLWWLVFCAGLGAIIGSFLNVLILRTEQEESVQGRSHCPHCGKILGALELIPVFSYLIQRGCCRGCGARISLQYPLVEAGTGILFVLTGYHLGMPLNAIEAMSFLLVLAVWSILVAIAVYDFRTTYIPDRFVFAFIAFAGVLMLLSFAGQGAIAWPHLLAGPLFFLPFWGLWAYSEGRWLGLGDGKLAIGIGWLLGFSAGLSAIMLSFWIGAAVSLLILGLQSLRNSAVGTSRLVGARGALTIKSEIPFGPFMIFATALVYFSGWNLIQLLTAW